MKFVSINVFLEGVKVPSCLAGRRGTSYEDSLESAHAGRKGMDDVHGNGSIIDVSSGVNNFLINLVSKVH